MSIAVSKDISLPLKESAKAKSTHFQTILIAAYEIIQSDYIGQMTSMFPLHACLFPYITDTDNTVDTFNYRKVTASSFCIRLEMQHIIQSLNVAQLN
ncbi:MAG TPA: hypothetical protein VIF82_17580 [Burkholderiaceae bacterium]|jgi:hypothetical protein